VNIAGAITPSGYSNASLSATACAWQKPHEVIPALALRPDAVVADIGSGTGYFAVRLASMVSAGEGAQLPAELVFPGVRAYLAGCDSDST
jgi:hypothetical protein